MANPGTRSGGSSPTNARRSTPQVTGKRGRAMAPGATVDATRQARAQGAKDQSVAQQQKASIKPGPKDTNKTFQPGGKKISNPQKTGLGSGGPGR